MTTVHEPGNGVNESSSAGRLRKVLSLDGGGIRGLSSIIILGYLMDQLKEVRGRRVDPWEEFDMIGGTSTGGITAIMLGRLRMSVDDCETAYTQLADAVFTPRRSNLDPGRVTDFLNANGKFDEQPLEAMIKERISDAQMEKNALFHDERHDACKVFVSVVRAEDGSPSVLRSYSSGRLLNRLLWHCKIWEAARATSAASTFFDPITIGPHGTKFVDGGLRHNNPIDLVERESRNLWPNDDRLLISIGTGDAPGGSFEGALKDLVDRLKEISTDTQNTSNRFLNAHSEMVRNKRLFRYDVNGLGTVGLDESRARPTIVARTENYLESPEVLDKSSNCIDTLALRGSRVSASLRPPVEVEINSPSKSTKDRTDTSNQMLVVQSGQSENEHSQSEDNTIHRDDYPSLMHRAAAEGDVDKIDQLRSLGYDVGVRDQYGYTPMHFAARYGQIAIIDHLRSLGQNVNVESNFRFEPMHEAARYGQIAMIDHLRSLGQFAGTWSEFGIRPMHMAAARGQITTVNHLRLLGEDIGVKDVYGYTPMHEAARYGQIAMIDHLRSLGQNINIKSYGGSTPMKVAAGEGQTAMVEHLHTIMKSRKRHKVFGFLPFR